MRIETVKCDECGVVKKDSNHWLHIDVLGPMEPFIHLGHKEPDPSFERRDLCGQGCFHRHLDKLLFPEKPVASGAPGYVLQTGELPDPDEGLI